jgi:hypothetical protein
VVHEPNGVDTDDYAMSVGPEVGATGSKKRKRVPLQHMDGDFSPSLEDSENEEPQQNSDDEDFEDGPLRSKKKLKVQHGHRVQHRTSHRSTTKKATSRQTNQRSYSAKDKENLKPTAVVKSSTSHIGALRSQSNHSEHDDLPKVRVLRQMDGSVTYQFDGFHCQHSEHLSSLTSSSPSLSGISLAIEDLDRSCAGLRAHSMFLYQPLRAVYCQKHMALIPYDAISTHILKNHRHTFQLQSSGSPFLDFMDHLRHAFGISSNPAECSTLKEEEVWEPIFISQPFPFLRSPEYYVLCPSTSCRHAFEVQRGSDARKSPIWRKHIRQHPNCQLALGYDSTNVSPNNIPWDELPLPKVRCGQIAYTASKGRWFLFLPDGWRPCAPLAASPSNTLSNLPFQNPSDKLPQRRFIHSAINQKYISQLGWDTALSPDVIDAYKALLYMAPSTDEEIALDRGLNEIHAFLFRYLQTANTFLGEVCIRVRQTMTAG